LELENSLENINASIERFKNENYRLRKNLPVELELPEIIKEPVPVTAPVGASRRMRGLF
jgi:hypothetical protein